MEKVNPEQRESTPATAGSSARGRAPKAKTLIAFSALIMLVFCVFVGYQASKAYETAIEDGKSTAMRLTRILSDQVDLTLLGVDLVLNRAVERQYFNTMFGGNLPHDIENNFRIWVNDTPQIVGMMMVDEHGHLEIVASKSGYDGWHRYLKSADTDQAFAALKDDAERGVYIDHQATGIAAHPQMIIMSRRINKLDGSFGGMISAAVDPDYFNDFFASVDQNSHRFMTLLLEDGSMLFTGPSGEEAHKSVIDFIGEAARKQHNKHAITADTHAFGTAIEIYAYTHLKSLPVTTAIVIDEDYFLHDWRKARMKDIAFLAIFTVFGSVLSYFALNMARQIQRVEQSESAAILASQAKSEFLANMSHELRTPLNAVIGFSEMLGAGYFGALNDKQKERVQDINLCGTHLLQLISDILEFSKGEAGKLELYEEEIDMARTVGEAVRIVSERAKGKQIALTTELDERLPILMADKRKVRQILLNLLSNAIKFTPVSGKVTVGVRIDHHRQMHMTVSDTGVGIAPEDIAKALAVFGQVHRSQSHEGTGLGLPLCKMFAELHGGKLQLTSEVGVGTTVRVIFPAVRVLQAYANS